MRKVKAYIKHPYGDILVVDPVKDVDITNNFILVTSEDNTIYSTHSSNILFESTEVPECDEKE